MKRILITAALIYANGPPHLGHIRSTYLPADIYARYCRLAGNEVLYICATDEHGTPIVISAENEKKKLKEFVDFYYKKDKSEFEQLGFSFDIFHRTSSVENKKMTEYIFVRLKENGHIYQKEIEQPYCEKCLRFLPDRFVIGTCPYCKSEKQYSDYCEVCGRVLKTSEIVEPKCIVCKNNPVMKKSTHYFFKLSSFSHKLKDYISKNPNFQTEIVNYVLNWINSGLIDWDISRDMDWGVKIPGESSKVFYVWFDAPIGYMSSTMAATKQWEKFWKTQSKIVHFIGKDISYHHYLFWPAMLMGANENFLLPNAIPVRGYLNLEHRKFSKSKGWFVSLGDFLAEFPPDYLRYYETAITPNSVEDANFIWKEFGARINNELVSNLGNFVHRTLVLIKKICNSEIPKPKLCNDDKKILAKITETVEKTAALLDKFEFRDAQDEIMRTTSEFNKYLSEREPWKDKNTERVATTLYVSSRWVSALTTLLNPFLPFTSQKLANMIGIKIQNWKDADKEHLKPGAKIGEVEILFKKIDDKQIERMEQMLKKRVSE
ncbi:MAG: methionine--tRNA ligase [Candidatus Micrarchaeota archaeon]